MKKAGKSTAGYGQCDQERVYARVVLTGQVCCGGATADIWNCEECEIFAGRLYKDLPWAQRDPKKCAVFPAKREANLAIYC